MSSFQKFSGVAFVAGFALASSAHVTAQTTSPVAGGKGSGHAVCVGESESSAAIRKAMEGFIAGHEISGAVTLVADQDKILHLNASGLADIERENR